MVETRTITLRFSEKLNNRRKEKMVETRTITQIRVYKLILNDMCSCAEQGSIVAVSTDYNALVNWYHEQMAPETYRDDRWCKTFIKGSSIEWFNPAPSLELNNTDLFNRGITDEWVNEERWIILQDIEKNFVIV